MNTVEEKQTEAPPRTFFTIPKFAQRHDDFLTEGSLRFKIFNAKENGLEESGAVVRIGRRVLINEEKYIAWIESQQKAKRTGGMDHE